MEKLSNMEEKKHTLRVYEMFMGDYTQDAPWSVDSLKGCKRFIDKVIRLKDKVVDGSEYSKDLEILIHKTIKKVENDLTTLSYNTAISALMILSNEFDSKNSISPFCNVTLPFDSKMCFGDILAPCVAIVFMQVFIK